MESNAGEFQFTPDILGVLREPVLLLDERMRIVAANDAFLWRFELERTSLVGRFVFDVPPGLWDRGELRAALQRAGNSEAADVGDVPIEHEFASGATELFTLRPRRLAAVNPAAECGRIVVAIDDVTPGDIARRAREASERARLAAIVQSSDDAIIGLSPDGKITSWNPGAEQLYGFTSDDMAGEPIAVIVPGEREAEMTRLLETVKRGERVEQFETVRVHRDGRRIYVSMTVSPVYDESANGFSASEGSPRAPHGIDSSHHAPRDGDIGVPEEPPVMVGVAMIERDISERKRVAAEIERAVQEAERANRAKGEFLANVSHELRTPMNAIIGMTEIALDEPLPERVRDYVETANESAEMLLRLLNDILDFSRIEAGRFEIDEAKFELRAVLEETVKALAIRAHEKGLEIALHIAPDVPDRLVGDPVRLRQVLTNLTGNAIKFTEAGEVVISVEPGPEAVLTPGARAAQAAVHFSVRDTGIGMSERDQEGIFAPFAQVDATSTRNHGGTGLGLAICHELVAMMQGRMWIESEIGQGSTFHFLARFGREPTGDRPVRPEVVSQLKDMPVLVVDDNASNREILAEAMRNWRMAPVLAKSADEALQEMERAAGDNHPFPLVYVDGQMPGTDGFALIEQLRSEESFSGTTVLMLSTTERHTFRDRCEHLHVANFLDKPVTQSELLDSIVTALGGPPLEKGDADEAHHIGDAARPLSVLLVEDTPANRKVVTAVLNKRGHAVTIASDGQQAIDIYLRRPPFDLILMDVQMPVMDGYQATGIIRTMEERQSSGKRTPIIAMTAHAMRGDRERCLAAGMDAYLSKPIDVRRMLRLVEKVAARSRRAEQRRGTAAGSPVAARPVAVSAPGESVPDESHQPTANRNRRDEMSRENPPFDKAGALERLGGDEQLFRELTQYFLEDSRELLETISEGAKNDDWPAVRIAAHSLKGLAANFNAGPATDSARQLEEAAAAGDGALARSLIDPARAEVEHLQAALTNSGEPPA